MKQQEQGEKRRQKNVEAAFEWYETLVVALAGVALLFAFGIRMVVVSGSSMEPTLLGGEQVMVATLMTAPKRGDIVVADSYTIYADPIIKRVIGVSGDVIDIDFKTGEITRNGELLHEPYISAPTTLYYDVKFPVTVPEGTVFLLGDNRPGSKDSRSSEIGFIEEKALLGRVILRTTPIQRFGVVK